MKNSQESEVHVDRSTIKQISSYFDQHYESWGTTVYDGHPERWYEYNISMFRENYALGMIKRETKGTAVDIGCGIGHALIILKRMGFEHVMGVDISDKMLAEAQLLLKVNQLLGEVELYQSDVQNLSMIKSMSVDVCIALGVIEYQDEDGPLLREVNRILKPGGAAVIQVRNYNCIYIRTMKLYQAALRRKPDRITYREHRPNEFRANMSKYGFRVDKEYFSHFYALYPLNIVPKVNRIIKPFDNYFSKFCESLSPYHFSRYLASMYIVLIRKESAV